MAGVDKMTVFELKDYLQKIEKNLKHLYALGNTNHNLSLDLRDDKMMEESDK